MFINGDKDIFFIIVQFNVYVMNQFFYLLLLPIKEKNLSFIWYKFLNKSVNLLSN